MEIIMEKPLLYENSYQINDIGIIVRSSDKTVLSSMNMYYGAFSSEIKSRNIEVHIGEFRIRKLDEIISLGNRYFLNSDKNMLIVNPTAFAKFNGNFRFILTGDIFSKDECIKLYFQNSKKRPSNFVGTLSHILDKIIWPNFNPEYVGRAGMINYDLETLIYFLLPRYGKTFLHAGGVSVGNDGVLIFGYPNVGKTSIVLELCRKGCGFLGDDLVILSEDGFMFFYPKFIQIEGFFIKGNPEIFAKIKKNMSLKQRLILNYMFKIYSGRLDKIGILQNIRAVINDVELKKNCKVNHLVQLIRFPGKNIKIKKIDSDILIRKLYLQLINEFKHRYIYEGCILAMQENEKIEENLLEVELNIKRIIRRALMESACYEMLIPETVKMNEVSEKLLKTLQ